MLKTTYKALLYFSLVILLSFVISTPSLATDKKKLTFSVFSLRPWGVMTANGEIDGIVVRMMEAISKKIDVEIDYRYVPYKRMLFQLESGTHHVSIFYRDDYNLSR